MNRVEFRNKILAANEAAAALLRPRFAEAGTLVLDLVSSPGSGKTTLLEETQRRLGGRLRMGVLVGDVATELDAERLRKVGLPAHQIVTGGACHLDARLVTDGLEAAGFPELDLLFLENVGNLVCPASYTLGEDFKVVLLSMTEGHDKPFKYPAIFRKASVALLTKSDLRAGCDFDTEVARRQITALNPEARVLELSARTGEGMEEWCELLLQAWTAKRTPARA